MIRLKQPMGKSRPSTWLWLGPLLFMAVIGLYFPIRFNGYWAEADSSTFTSYIRDFINVGKIVPPDRGIYPNGYAFQAISTFVVSLTGLEVKTLQQWIYPLLAVIVVLPAWIAYRELTGSNHGAALATLLLLIQPEFLFVILRSSHEKFTRVLMLLCLFLLARSLGSTYSRWNKVTYLSLFCVAIFAVITNNYLLANSFIFSIVMIYMMGWVLEKLRPHLKLVNGGLRNRLQYIIPVCIGLVYIFTIHIYPPAYHNIRVLQNTWEGIATLFLSAQDQSEDIYIAYSYVVFGWINLPTYIVLSIANWIVLIISFAIWMYQGWHWIWRSGTPKNQMAWLLWLLYAAFSIQEVLAAISDASGALSSNLQLRLFPSFSMIAVAMIATAWTKWRPKRFARSISIGLAGALFCISIFSVWKATNEPSLSNKWNFYSPNEILALEWGDKHLQNAEIWTEFDERLQTAYLTEIGYPNVSFTTIVTPNTRDMLLSTIIRLRGGRIRQPLPVPHDALQVYDNGAAQLYHLRPQSPYQP